MSNRIRLSEDELSNDKEQPKSKRAFCTKCRRPQRVCLCFAIPRNPLPTQTCIVILQSAAEAKAKVKTADLVPFCIQKAKVHPMRKGVEAHIPADAVLLYPTKHSLPLSSLEKRPKTVVLLDATWSSAQRMFSRSPFLQALQQVHIPDAFLKAPLFKVRKAPTTEIKGARSTAEAVASAIHCLEGDESLPSVQAIRRCVHEASEMQLAFVRRKANGGQHRTERAGYEPALYDNNKLTDV